jgi:hypothetical protein
VTSADICGLSTCITCHNSQLPSTRPVLAASTRRLEAPKGWAAAGDWAQAIKAGRIAAIRSWSSLPAPPRNALVLPHGAAVRGVGRPANRGRDRGSQGEPPSVSSNAIATSDERAARQTGPRGSLFSWQRNALVTDRVAGIRARRAASGLICSHRNSASTW